MASTVTFAQKSREERIQEVEPLRTEDYRLLRGEGHFVDDFNLPGQAYMGVVKSPLAHAKIIKIDFSKVTVAPEYIASLTGEDLIKQGVQPVTQNQWPPQKPAKRYHLAVGKVRYAGEPVAAILAKSESSLEDLLELVEVEYERLPPVTTIKESRNGNTLVYEEWKNNISQTGEEKTGDSEGAIALSPYVIQINEGIKRQHGAPIEPHAVLVSYDSSRERFEIISTVQSVHGLRNLLSLELKLPKEKFHVKVLDMGGGFGTKGGPSYPWPLLACIFARRTGLAVKFTATRTEEFLEAAAGRDEYCNLTMACDLDGKISALKARIECDVGVTGTQAHMPFMTMSIMTGPYEIPNLDMKVTAYVTNKMPIGPVRGAGAPEGCYFIERAVEIMARKIGLDPIEFRRRNVSGPVKSGGEDYQKLMDAVAHEHEDLSRWAGDLYEQFRAGRSKILGGIGVSLRGEKEEIEDSEDHWQSAQEQVTKNKAGLEETFEEVEQEQPLSFMTETARVVLHSDGRGAVYTGSSPHGQGHETVFAQLASEELGIPFERVQVIWGDTDLIHQGVGTFGSRSATTGGSAVVEASKRVKLRLLRKASEALGVDERNLDLKNGVLIDRSGLKIPLDSVMSKIGLKEISARSAFTLRSLSYSSGIHICAVALDVDTGNADVKRYTVAEDCGRIINNAIVEGQIHGGVIHGIGGSLYEGLTYDEEGNLLTTTFMDYEIPSSLETPDVKVIHLKTPSRLTPHGAKGVGESGTIGSYAAVINALNDAVSRIGRTKEVNIAPARPEEIYAKMHS